MKNLTQRTPNTAAAATSSFYVIHFFRAIKINYFEESYLRIEHKIQYLIAKELHGKFSTCVQKYVRIK